MTYTFSDFIGIFILSWVMIVGSNAILMMLYSIFRGFRSPDPKKLNITYQDPL